MRFLDANEMIALLPADARVEQEALALLNPLFSAHNGNAERLPLLKQQGFLKSAQINHELRPAFVLWYRVELDRLVVDTVVSVGSNSTADFCSLMMAGVQQIAHAHGCRSVEGVTAQAGLARLYRRAGFDVCGVLVRKEIANAEVPHG